MASCEKCWERSGGDVEKYHRLLRENDCSPEEQAGVGATECQFCGRKTIHQYAGVCVNPDCATEARAKDADDDRKMEECVMRENWPKRKGKEPTP